MGRRSKGSNGVHHCPGKKGGGAYIEGRHGERRKAAELLGVKGYLYHEMRRGPGGSPVAFRKKGTAWRVQRSRKKRRVCPSTQKKAWISRETGAEKKK